MPLDDLIGQRDAAGLITYAGLVEFHGRAS
jgi:hypothetical protein